MITKDGRIVWVQDEATLVRLPNKPPYWQGFLLDVTERKEAESQLERALDVEREATQRLRALDEMKNTFLQAVSHDLRTPLAAILGLAITLERGDIQLADDDAKISRHRIAVEPGVERPGDDLFDLDRLARGIVASKRRVDRRRRARRGRPRRVRAGRGSQDGGGYSTGRPPGRCREGRAHRGEPARQHHATYARSASMWVRVRLNPTASRSRSRTTGRGPGCGRRHRFEPFRQGLRRHGTHPGVGVGLTLVRRFAELHGGRAWVEDRVGGGASFRVFLPAAGPSRADAAGRPRGIRCSGGLVGAPATGRLGRGVLSRPPQDAPALKLRSATSITPAIVRSNRIWTLRTSPRSTR